MIEETLSQILASFISMKSFVKYQLFKDSEKTDSLYISSF